MGATSLADSNICRLCGADSENPVLIFDAEDEEPFCIKINRYLPIQVYDDGRYPRRVCSGCYLSVTATQVFLDRTLEGQRTIHYLLQENHSMCEKGSLYPAGNLLQHQLTEGGVVPQKRRPGRPRKGESKPKEPKPSPPPPVELPPQLERSRRPRGRLPARFQDTVGSRELERVLQERGGDPVPLEEPLSSEAADREYRAPCHIRVEVLSATGESADQTGDTTADTTTARPPQTAAPAPAAAADGNVVPAEGSAEQPAAAEQAGQPAAAEMAGQPTTADTAETPVPKQLPGKLPRGRRRKLRYQCEVCGKKFLQEGRLKFHRGLHRGVRYECLGCTVRFKQSTELAFHQTETGHTGQGVVEGVDDEVLVDRSRLPCPQCPRTFSTQSTLQIHTLQRHNADKQFSCDVCHKRFGQLGSLKLHQKSHTVRTRPRFSCGECGKVCNSNTALAYHTETTHGTAGRLFLCNLCGKSFRHQQLLARHAIVHTTERKWKCPDPECTSSFKTKSHLANHMVRHTGERRYGCHLCSQRFAHKTTLTMHLRWHRGEKPHECSVCKKRFTQHSNLCEHERIHTGEKPYPCTVCSRAFTTACQLSTHMRCHGGGRQMVCQPCGKVFSSRDQWRAHGRLHGTHRPLACPTCGKQLADKWSLRNHIRTHSGKAADSSFVCDVCSWTFDDASSLEQHRVTHAAGDGAALLPTAPPAPPQVVEPLLQLDSKESQVIYVTYQNPGDPSTVQLIDSIATVDGAQTVHLSADSEVLLEDAAAGVVQLAANKGLVTAEGTRTLELTTEDGRRIQITLQDDKGDLEATELDAVTSDITVDPAGDTLEVDAEVAEESEAEDAVLTEEPAAVLVTASDGRQFRLVTPAGADPVQFATEYIAGLTGETAAAFD